MKNVYIPVKLVKKGVLDKCKIARTWFWQIALHILGS